MNFISTKAQSIVRASPKAVYDAFVDAEQMSKFWFTRRDTGLEVGSTVSWYIGRGDDAFEIEVRVLELKVSELIRIEWQGEENFTQVLWQMQETNDGYTKLIIEESGFKGSDDQIISNALDSTAGFNQVIIALKALLEHDVAINVVDDHA